MQRLISLLFFVLCALGMVGQNAYQVLADSYAEAGDYNKAIYYENLSIETETNLYGETTENCAVSLFNIARYYYELRDLNNALEYGLESQKVIQDVIGEDNQLYGLCLMNLSLCYDDLGLYNDALSIGLMAFKVLTSCLSEVDRDVAVINLNLSRVYGHKGDFDQAIAYVNESIRILESSSFHNSGEYATALMNLALFKSEKGLYQEAIDICERCLSIQNLIYGSGDYQCALTMLNMGRHYYMLGNYVKSLEYTEMAKDIFSHYNNGYSLEYAMSLFNISLTHMQLEKDSRCIEELKLAMSIQEEIAGISSPTYAQMLQNLSLMYICRKDFYNAIKTIKTSLALQEANDLMLHPNYVYTLETLALIYSQLQTYENAIEYTNKALEIYSDLYGTETPKYASMLKNLAFYQLKTRQFDIAYDNYKKTYLFAKKYIIDNLFTMSAQEMELFWLRYEDCCKYGDDDVRYDQLLFRKGILLNTNKNIRSLIQSSGDMNALNLMNEMDKNKLILNQQLSVPIFARTIDVDSLQQIINQQQKELGRISTVYCDIHTLFSATWEQVRNSLNPGEAAIEFIDDMGLLQALIVTPTCVKPIWTHFYEDFPSKLVYESEDGLELNESILDTINRSWSNIRVNLDGISRVYFSPAGALNVIPIENILNDGIEYIRLTSTRNLINRTYALKSNYAKLFGGLKYDTSTSQIEDLLSKPMAANQTRNIELTVDKERSSWGFLPGTLIEVTEIQKIFNDYPNYNCDTYTLENGLEEYVKGLSGSQISILHLSTHGYYYRDSTSIPEIIKQESIFDNYEDNALNRSGLLMSGAYNSLNSNRPLNIEDGILTAKEISSIDLNGCDIVVLSACETGLGDLSTEGVYGLQRGFKKAGVNSILMSLWKVNDEATCRLMIEFYKNYLSGCNKVESLKRAQNTLQRIEEFSDPECWAGFILIDALN